MVSSLAKTISHFPGAANRARCTAHIVNLVTKIILCQFYAKKKAKEPKKKSENANEDAENTNEDIMEQVDDEDDLEMVSLSEGLDREEQEVADDEGEEMSENVADVLEEIEEAMKEEVSEVAKNVKPIQRVLFKVSDSYSFLKLLMKVSLFLLSAP